MKNQSYFFMFHKYLKGIIFSLKCLNLKYSYKWDTNNTNFEKNDKKDKTFFQVYTKFI
jgi:hypothetical protein